MKIQVRTIFVASVAVALVLSISLFANIKPTAADDTSSFLIGTCPSQSFLHGPSVTGQRVVLNIGWKANNDEDSGLAGYWSLDYFVEHVTVWQFPNGTFYAVKFYAGIFQTPQGAISPGTAAKAENVSAFGSIIGGYVAKFDGVFNPGTKPTSGFIGTKDYGGTLVDVLKGTYGNGQVRDRHPYDWVSAYFTSNTYFNQPHWGWAYQLGTPFRASSTINQWCNYNTVDGGNSGDILVPS
jgi:hypothetical protein